MRISRVSVRGLRVHRSLDVDLAPGLTIVRGPNESGKSTLQRAIELALFRRVTSGGTDIDGLRSWGAGEEDRPIIEVAFVDEHDEGVRTGVVRKDFRGNKGAAHLELDGEEIRDPARVDEVLADLTGIPSEKFFRSTACVRHHELSDLARDEGALRDRLQASISGADRGTSVAKRRLERAIHDLATRGEKNPGRLRVAEQAVSGAQAAVTQGEALLAQLEADRDALGVARQRRAEAEATLAEHRSLLEKARQAERLVADREVARERFERNRQAVAVSEQIVALDTAHPSPRPLRVLRPSVEALRALDREVAELRAQLGKGSVSVEYDAGAPTARWRTFAVLAFLVMVAGSAGIVAGVLLDLVAAIAGGGLGVVLGLILGIVALRRRRSGRRGRQQQLREDEISRRLRGRTQMEADLDQRELAMTRQLDAIQQPDLAAAEDVLRREEEHVQAIERARAQLEGLIGRVPPQTLPMLRDAAALEIEQKTGALEALGPIAKEPRARERLEVELREADVAVESARDQEAAARARVEQNPVDAEQVAGETERLARWREQLAALQRRARIYQLALDALVEAEVATLRTATHYLEKQMRLDVGRLSGGRYRRVKVDHATLDLSVYAPERHGWVRVEELSQGTLDMAYLAARLGLVRLVTHDRRPPLVFDDPFVTFDDERAARAFDVLRDLTRDYQAIYLTTSERYDAAADRVVVLAGPTATDEGADAAEAEEAAARMAELQAGEAAAHGGEATAGGAQPGGASTSADPPGSSPAAPTPG